jgi:tyrosine phenol-lyase
MLFPSTRAHIEMTGAKIVDVISDVAHDLTSTEPFKGNLDVKKLAAVFQEHGAEKVSCIYVELSVNSCGGQPVSLANLRAVKALAAVHKTPVFLDACRILENSFSIQEREPEQRCRSLREIVEATCALADGCTLSALKDFLVSAGGMILTRDRASYQKAMMQSFLDGVQPSGSAMELMAAAMGDIFASDSHVASRVQQVKYLWDKLHNDVPLVSPPAGHAVFIDLKQFLAHVPSDRFRAEALAAFVYLHSGIRVTKGPPLAPSQLARGTELLRLAVPARKYVQGHMDDIASALHYAFAHRDEIEGLKRLDDPARSKYDPAHFTLLV